MKVYIFGDYTKKIVSEVIIKCLVHKFEISHDISKNDIGIAPYQKEKIPEDIIKNFKYGVLIFHPSLLPMHGGMDAIKQAFKRKAYYSGITWFWGNERFDAGEICEQSVIRIDEGETPKEYYENKCIPEALRMLDYALTDIKNGIIRKRKQNINYGSYEKKELVV